MAYSLVLLNGTTPGAGVPLDPDGPPVTLGRDPACDFPIDDHLCSRLHARVWFDRQQWHVEDCGSRNGTYLNSEPIQRGTLQPGDAIKVGERLIVFVREGEPDEEVGWQPSKLETTTFVARVPAPEQKQAVVDQLYATADSGSFRNAAILCRLSGELHDQDNMTSLVKLVSDAISAGTEADVVTVWMVGSAGRLRAAGDSESESASSANPNVLANLVVDSNEALMVQHPAGDVATSSGGNGSGGLGMAICVPIPHRTGRRGAIECVRNSGDKSFSHQNLELVIAIAHQFGLALENLQYRERLEQANQQLRKTVASKTRIIGDSTAVRDLHEMVARVAATHSTVLIYGESGTGKELVARMIHESSPRSAGPYIPINCAAFNETLLENELFGHEKGAFTGADRRHQGQFERAHRGTIFLDEVGEMSPSCQAKLLRLLEGHAFERLGGSQPIQVDVRIVSATHRTLTDLVQDERFREDLYFRLRVIELSIPPLRERGDDIVQLAAHFLDQYRRETGRGPERLSEDAIAVLRQYAWPGNVRELKNSIERAVVLGRGSEVSADDLGLPDVGVSQPDGIETLTLADAERRHIQQVLDQMQGNKTQACKALGIGRGTLYKKLRE